MILGTNSAEPSAAMTAGTHVTGACGKAPKSTAVSPSVVANGHMAQNVTMKGAAMNGNGTHFDIATVTAAVTIARIGMHTHAAGLAWKKAASAKPISAELNPKSPRSSSTSAPRKAFAASVPTTPETT